MDVLKGKVALVSGASKGIGAAIAIHLAAAGAKVFVNYASSQAGAEKTAAIITESGGSATVIHGDFSKPDDVVRVFSVIAEKDGKLDILVNNAAIYAFSPLEQITVESFNQHFNLNVLGLLLATQEAVKLMGPEGGSIINISSLSAMMAPPQSAVYSGTKGAVNSITIALSKELGPRKIRVNSLSPGAVATEGTALFNPAIFEGMAKQTPLRRVGQPEDIAKIAVFLASEDSYWITGQDIHAAGGMTL